MKKYLLKLCLPIGLMIFAVYQITNHFVTVSDSIAVPSCITSIIFMLIGVAYQGWHFGKRY